MHKKGKAELAGYEPRYFQLRRDRLRTLEWYDADVSPGELPPEPKGRICLKSEGLKDVRETAVEPAAKLQRSEWGIEIDYQEHGNDLRTYMLCCADESSRTEWLQHMRLGQEPEPEPEPGMAADSELEVGRGNRYAKVGSGGRYAITQEQPFWVDSGSVGACETPGCGTSFGVLERKHHCRSCGHVFCAPCSEATHMLFPRPPDAATAAVAAGKSPGRKGKGKSEMLRVCLLCKAALKSAESRNDHGV